MEQAAVVYYFGDPAYHGDITAAIEALSERGYRVVRGDNADELLFLLQVGRPAAVIYTLASPESMTSATFQMVSRRAFDLLVPIVAVGPEDPRDGVTLVYPEGRKSTRLHIPFHSLVDTIIKFDQEPPSTPSRPPEVLERSTLGKGRTMLSWQPPSVTASSTAAALESAQQPVETKAHVEQAPAPMSEIGDFGTSPPSQSAQRSEPSEVESAKRSTLESEVRETASSEVPEQKISTDSSVRSTPHRPSKSRTWSVVGPVMGTIATGAVVVAIYLAAAPSGSPPKPIRITTQIESNMLPVNQADTQDHSAANRASSETTGDVAKSNPAPAAGAPTAEPSHDRQVIQDKVEPTAEEIAAASPVPVGEIVLGQTVRFPAHFRTGTATFWFSSEAVEREFLSRIAALGRGRTVQIIGHPTVAEARTKNWSIGLSRAWAVEKYLIRNGMDPANLKPFRGLPAEPNDDTGERGWQRNRWVDILIE